MSSVGGTQKVFFNTDTGGKLDNLVKKMYPTQSLLVKQIGPLVLTGGDRTVSEVSSKS